LFLTIGKEKQDSKKVNSTVSTKKNTVKDKKRTDIDFQEQEKKIKKLKNQINQKEKEIESLELEKSKIETQLADPEIYSDSDKLTLLTQEIGELNKKIQTITDIWEKNMEKLELLES